MLTLEKNASMKYLEINRLYAREIAEGKKDSKLSDLLNVIHDKYKVVQLYPKIGKEVAGRENVRIVDLLYGWKMIYEVEFDAILVIDFVKEDESGDEV